MNVHAMHAHTYATRAVFMCVYVCACVCVRVWCSATNACNASEGASAGCDYGLGTLYVLHTDYGRAHIKGLRISLSVACIYK